MIQPPQAVLDLVARFQRNHDAYAEPGYNETQARREFIDPFFKALGWDVDNESGVAEAYKDVIHEDAIKIGGATKAPDYCFRIGGTRKFFIEAKKPAVGLSTDPEPAYQLRRYAWTSKLPLSVLTDFEEFAVYDCRIRPSPSDKAATARVFYCRFDEYPSNWEWIADHFSKDAVLKGAFDRYAESNRRKRGTAEVDAEILKEIEGWRETLAQNFALRNAALAVRELNFAVQRTIDRIIFLRMCEDRGIEPYGQLLGLVNGPALYSRLGELFRRADERYNSSLFYFTAEQGREPPDDVTLALQLDDRVLKDILKALYYPDSPYEFSVLPPEILGYVYEQFLGKVIRLTAGHRAKVEEKPEVRKAGGVYYTPTYIVDYIVKQTVGKLLEGKTPADVGPDLERLRRGRRVAVGPRPKNAAPLRVLDPACGSGSFLLGAYQYLIDWHRDWYVADGSEKHPDRVYQGPGGQWRLTIQEKKRILLNNIYGVDIDPQAVETTKLSLLLKVLEGETAETIGSTLRLFHERALPDLDRNIKCGNSLIGPDFYDRQQMSLFDEDERLRINAFDWHAEFPDVFTSRARKEAADPAQPPEFPGGRRTVCTPASGFDAVIGNPPYVLLQGEFRDDLQLAYFRQRYRAASYKLDTYHLFIERAISLTRKSGRSAMITPANFLTNNHLAALRRLLLECSAMDHILVVDGGVFRGISVDNTIYVVLVGGTQGTPFPVSHAVLDGGHLTTTSTTLVCPKTALDDEHVLFTGSSERATTDLWSKIGKASTPLGSIASVNFGKQLRDRTKYVRDVITVSSIEAVPRRYRACLTGRDVTRYSVRWGGLACLDADEARCGGCWNPQTQNATYKLLTRQVGRRPEFGLDIAGLQCLNTMFMVNLTAASDPRFVLGVLNSRLIAAYWVDHFYDQRRTFPKIKGTYLKQLPILTVSPPSARDRLVALVQQMLDLHKSLAAAKTAHEKTALQRQIDATDRQIDQLVYELYALTDDEIRIVEEASQK